MYYVSWYVFRFLCMRRIENNEADLMTLDSGLGYFAGRQHNLMPIMAEKYGAGMFGVVIERECFNQIKEAYCFIHYNQFVQYELIIEQSENVYSTHIPGDKIIALYKTVLFTKENTEDETLQITEFVFFLFVIPILFIYSIITLKLIKLFLIIKRIIHICLIPCEIRL